MTFGVKYDLINGVMRDTIWINNWEKFLGEVKAACNYWELGFGDIDAEYESEVVRWAFVNKLDVDAACDAWREAVAEIAIGG